MEELVTLSLRRRRSEEKKEKNKGKMTKRFSYIIYSLLLSLVFVGCTDDASEQPECDVTFCVRAAWQDGLGKVNATRALTATDILADGTSDIVINTDDYPTVINVHCSDGTDFTLTKGSALCSTHNDYWTYTASEIYKDNKIKRDNLTFSATATIDDGDELAGEATILDINDQHMLLTLHHTKALLRFAFKLDERYNIIRYIKITNINFNGTDIAVADKVLGTTGQFIAYAYIDPATVTVSKENAIQCTYNIYDKDTDFNASESEIAKHITRRDIVAKNTFKLNALKDKSSNAVTAIQAGYYYDLRVTLNPDYLYVLSEHDNKHITIE